MICSNDKARESLDSQVSWASLHKLVVTETVQLAFHEARQGLLSQRKVHFQKRTEEHQKRKAETVKAQQKDSNTVICLDETETERHQIHLESEIYRYVTVVAQSRGELKRLYAESSRSMTRCCSSSVNDKTLICIIFQRKPMAVLFHSTLRHTSAGRKNRKETRLSLKS